MFAAMDFPGETDRPSLRELLAFYAEAGVDDALTDEPVDRFLQTEQRPAAPVRQAEQAQSSATASRQPERMQQPAMPMAPIAVPDEAQVALARQRAATAASLDELRRHMAEFEGCNLKFTAKNLVFGDGNPEADIMLVGEAPGRDEDLEGLPFVGRSGQLLDRMLAAIGLDRTKVYIANMVPWRPPGNRNPTPEELALCSPFLHRQVELVAPTLLVTLGNVPTQSLFATSLGITRMRGQWKSLTVNSLTLPALPTLHPAYLLRTPASKAMAWQDMLSLKAAMAEHGIA